MTPTSSAALRKLATASAIGVALILTGCASSGGDPASDPPAPDEPGSQPAPDDAPENEAPEESDDSMVEGFGTAEVTFLGETTVFEADGPAACRAYSYGENQDDVNFGGFNEAGDEFSAGWSSDSPGSETASFLASGEDISWNTVAGGPVMDVALISDHSAEVTAELFHVDGGRTETLTATITCPPM